MKKTVVLDIKKWSRKGEGSHREHHREMIQCWWYTVLRGHEKGTVIETTRSYEGRPVDRRRRDSNQGRSCYYHSFIREDSHSSVVSFGQTPQLTEENAVITADIIGGESHIRLKRGVQFTGALGEYVLSELFWWHYILLYFILFSSLRIDVISFGTEVHM